MLHAVSTNVLAGDCMDLLDCAFHITRFDIYVCMKYLYNDKHSYKMYMLLSSDEIY